MNSTSSPPAAADPLKVCVFGAGAVGGYMAARLIDSAAAQVSIVARGAHLEAIRRDGLRLQEGGYDDLVAHPAQATDQPATLPGQDLVIVTLKSTALAAAAEDIGRLLAPGAAAIFVTNGIPWWWEPAAPSSGGRAAGIDPQGLLWRHVTPARSIGCVALSSNVVESPGVVRHNRGNVWQLGEPGGGASERVMRAVALWRRAGLQAEGVSDIREEVWKKLLLNVPSHALSSLTRLSSDRVHADPGLVRIVRQLVEEVSAVARADGYPLGNESSEAILARLKPTAPGVRSSMLQDVLAGRPLEVEAVFGEVHRIALRHGVAVPHLEMAMSLLRGLDQSLAETAGARPAT